MCYTAAVTCIYLLIIYNSFTFLWWPLCIRWARSIQPKFLEILVQNSMDCFSSSGKVSKKKTVKAVRLGNLVLDFKIWISNLHSNLKSENRFKPFSTGYLFLDFHSRTGKTVLKNSGLGCVRIISKKKTAVHENSFANLFPDVPIERYKGNPWNPDLDFLIEIHPEDGFLRGEICFWISRLIAKSKIRVSKSKSRFPNRMQPYYLFILLLILGILSVSNKLSCNTVHLIGCISMLLKQT